MNKKQEYISKVMQEKIKTPAYVTVYIDNGKIHAVQGGEVTQLISLLEIQKQVLIKDLISQD